MQNKITCETPTPGKAPTRIDRWKYDCVRAAILKALPKSGEGLPFTALPELVGELIGEDELSRLGSVTWYTTTVKLDLEVRGEILRVAGASPQRLLKV